MEVWYVYGMGVDGFVLTFAGAQRFSGLGS